MSAPVRQRALTLLLPVMARRGAELTSLLESRRKAVQAAFGTVTTLHFARLVVLPSREHDDHELAFESNFDGELDPHLDELWAAAGAILDEIFGFCSAWTRPGSALELRRFARTAGQRSAAFYVAYPGLSRARVLADSRLRDAADDWLDRNHAELVSCSELEIARRLQAELAGLARAGANFDLSHVERGSSVTSGGLWRVARLYPFGLAYRLFVGLAHELVDMLADWRRPPRLDTPAVRRRLDEIGRHQDRLPQNGLTHLVPIKPGRFRSAMLKLMLRLTQELGELGELDSTHFARWLVLADGRLLFFSNYDGSSEAYLGDAIDKSAAGVSMIWGNTEHFPPTLLSFFRGARDEERFKRWTRAYQYPTQIWYSAYPRLSVGEVLQNHELRELLVGELDGPSAARLCQAL